MITLLKHWKTSEIKKTLTKFAAEAAEAGPNIYVPTVLLGEKGQRLWKS